MVADQLIVAFLLQNVFQARHGDQAHAVLSQIVPDGFQHNIRSWLVL